MAQVAVRLVVVGLGGFDQGIEAGAGSSTGRGVHKLPVVAPDHEGSDSVLNALS